jgi:hypothetical protein
MKQTVAITIFSVVFLQACIPRTAVVHDGLKTTVMDAATKRPIGGAFAYDRLEAETKTPHVLANSNANGELFLDAKSKLAMGVFLGEAMVFRSLWVCKEGYAPHLVGSTGGWNSDYGPSRIYTPNAIELSPSSLPPAETCLAMKHEN